MASSVARMPREEWTGQSMFVGSHGKHLKKLHVPKISIPTPKSKEVESETESDSAVLTPSRRQHQKILDRWAARQAREMVTTIERQAHEAEISALTNMSQPVSKRAQCFLHHGRETSPTPSDMSVASAPGMDVLQTVRASSLIQMWRDLEGSTPRAGTPVNPTVASWPEENNGVTVRAVVRGRGEIEELVSRMEAERRRELCFIAERRVVSQFPYRGRLQSMIKLRFLWKDNPDWDKIRVPPVKVKQEQFKKYSEKSQSSRKIIAPRQHLKCQVQDCNNRAMSDESCTNSNIDPTVDSTAESSQSSKSKGEPRKSPKTKPEEIKHNNQLQHQGQIASPKGNKNTETPHQAGVATLSANNKMYQADVATLNNVPPENDHPPAAAEATILGKMENNINLIIADHGAIAKMTTTNNRETETEDNIDPTIEDEIDAEMAATNETECSCSPSSMNEEDDDGEEENMSVSRTPESSSWDERNLWLGGVDWQRSIEPTTPSSWPGEVVLVEDLGAFPWSCDSPNSWRALIFRDVFENISDNSEIRDLLERRRVTTALESDFCAKMNRLILSLLQRQGQYNSVGDNFEEEFETKPYWRLNYELRNVDRVPSASSSLVPFQYRNNTANHNNWQCTTSTHNLPQNSVDAESMNQLRSGMSQIHDEISELRKLIESCVHWQVKLQDSIKHEVTNAVSQAVGNQTGSSNCRICRGAQVNSLLYRCGHMCACFTCSQNLQLNSHKCPICQSPIEDVVHVNPNS